MWTDRQTDRQTDMTMLNGRFSQFCEVLENLKCMKYMEDKTYPSYKLTTNMTKNPGNKYEKFESLCV